MQRVFQRSLLAALGLATSLAACSAGPLSDQVPEALGGLPAGTPARPVAPYQYPAVHDMPPDRPTAPLSEDAQDKLERELRATRDRQEAQEGQTAQGSKTGAAKNAATTANKKVVLPPKNQSDDVIVVPPAGVKANP
jgi:hypothetical protein